MPAAARYARNDSERSLRSPIKAVLRMKAAAI
jgi:hypothetical protein